MVAVEIFTSPFCGYCRRAKALLDTLGVSYQEYDISDAEHRRQYQQRLPRERTVPQIFIDGDHIGGCDDLMALHRRGQLVPKLGLDTDP